MDAIILDGNVKQALAAVRSLGREGLRLTVGATRASAMALHSRYTHKTFIYPDPQIDQAAFVMALKDWAMMADTPPVVYAFSDATSATIQRHRGELQDAIVFAWVQTESFDIAYNKAATYSEAKLLGVPVIPTWLLDNEEEVKRRSGEFSYPMVVKPRESVTWVNGAAVSGTASFALAPEEVRERFSLLKKATGDAPLLQPLVRGEEYGVEVLAEEGVIVAKAAHHRLRSMSPTGGASVLKESITTGSELEKMRRSAKIFTEALAWTGPIMFEFKVDADNQTPYLMEINGRWWGSMPLSVAAGVDFPYLYYQLMRGELSVTEPVTATEGVVTRHFLGDVRHLFRALCARDPMRPILYPSRKFALREFCKVPQGTKSDVWSWRDIRPGLWEYIDVIKRFSGGR